MNEQHQAERERLKHDLAAAQRTLSDQSDQLTKLKKQVDAHETRTRELTKSKSTAEAEAKELRLKLRASEHERGQLVGKQGDLTDARRAATDADARRREESREKDRRIGDLEKALKVEQRRRETAEARGVEIEHHTEGMMKRGKEEREDLVQQLQAAQAEVEDAKLQLETTQDDEAKLLNQLRAFKGMLALAAKQYGYLASASVSSSVHTRLKTEHATLQLRTARLERKLANSEDQVQELAHLIRQTKEQGRLLAQQLRDAEEQAQLSSRFLRDRIQEDYRTPVHLIESFAVLYTIGDELHKTRLDEAIVDLNRVEAQSRSWEAQARQLLVGYSISESTQQQLCEDIQIQQSALKANTTQLDSLAAELANLRMERDEARLSVTNAEAALQNARKLEMAATKEVEDMKQVQLRHLASHDAAVAKEKEAIRRSATALQKSKLTEESLQAEIEQ
jgi:chromosome segregation ATPase